MFIIKLVPLLLLFLLVILNTVRTLKYPKCCARAEYLKETHQLNNTSNNTYITYKCEKYKEIRFNIVTVFNKNVSKSIENCIDVTNNGIYLFKVSGKYLYEKLNKYEVDENLFFRKCCPVNYVYDQSKRSCVYIENETNNLVFKEEFVKIGLPNCSIIQDFQLNNSDVILNASNTNKLFSSENYCIDKTISDKHIFRSCKNNYDICKSKRCVRKCCPDGYSFINSSKCSPSFQGFALNFTKSIQEPHDDFVIVHGFNCGLYLAKESRYIFNLDTKGVFSIYQNQTNQFLRIPPEQEDQSYCIEHSAKNNIKKFSFFRCLKKNESRPKFNVSRWAKILSCICLVITLTVYLVLPEMRNLFGKLLISYSVAILYLFMFLVYSQFNYAKIANGVCTFIGFNITYASLCNFFWMNIICFDVWCTLGSSRNYLRVQQKRKDLKRFLLYSLYGFGTPLIWTLIIYIFYKTESLPFKIKAFIGYYKCVFERREGNYAYYIFYILPILILITANLVLFVKTVTYCWKVKGEISKMKDTSHSNEVKKKIFAVDKERVLLVLKLSIIMGISFLFEVVSSAVNFNVYPVTEYIEVVWDTINCLQGVFIFIVFICKSKVYNSFLLKFGLTKLRKISMSSNLNPTTSMTNCAD